LASIFSTLNSTPAAVSGVCVSGMSSLPTISVAGAEMKHAAARWPPALGTYSLSHAV
jgi:hypothetical protein